MFVIKDGRNLNIGDKVEVYYNLHKGGFSILSHEKEFKGKVVAYSSNVQIKNAVFKVSESGLKRIQDNKVRLVYAKVKGIFIGAYEMDISNMNKVYINPYTCPYFTCNGERIYDADNVYFEKKLSYIF
jgi:hypothetical protein